MGVRAKTLLVHIDDLQTPCPIYKYFDESTIFEICNLVTVIQDSADIVEHWSCNNDIRIPKKWLYVSEETEHL